MSSPVYDGQGQPPVASGWLASLAKWTGLTPRYVTPTRRSAKGTSPSGGSSPDNTGGAAGAPAGAPVTAAGAPAGAPVTPAAPSGSQAAASGPSPSGAPD